MPAARAASRWSGVEVGRGGDVDGVHVLAGEELLVGLRPAEEARRDRPRACRTSRRRRRAWLLARSRLSCEHVADRRDHGARVLEEGRAVTLRPRPPQPSRPRRTAELACVPQTTLGLQDRDAGARPRPRPRTRGGRLRCSLESLMRLLLCWPLASRIRRAARPASGLSLPSADGASRLESPRATRSSLPRRGRTP